MNESTNYYNLLRAEQITTNVLHQRYSFAQLASGEVSLPGGFDRNVILPVVKDLLEEEYGRRADAFISVIRPEPDEFTKRHLRRSVIDGTLEGRWQRD